MKKLSSSLNVDIIDEVIDQGDLISVKLKDGKQFLYNKADITVNELKRLEKLKLFKRGSQTGFDSKIPRSDAEWNEYLKGKYGADWYYVKKKYKLK